MGLSDTFHVVIIGNITFQLANLFVQPCFLLSSHVTQPADGRDANALLFCPASKGSKQEGLT